MKRLNSATKALLVIAMCLFTVTSALAGNCTINIKCTNPSEANWKIQYTRTAIPSWENMSVSDWTLDDDGYYTATATSPKNSMVSGSKTRIIVEAKGNYYLVSASGDGSYSDDPTQNETTVLEQNVGLISKTYNITIDIAEAVPCTSTFTLLFDNNDPEAASVVWNANGDNIDVNSASESYSKNWTEYYVNGILIKSEGDRYFDNTLMVTPADKCVVDYSLTTPAGDIFASGSDVIAETEIASWNTETDNINGATLTVNVQKPYEVTITINEADKAFLTGWTESRDDESSDLDLSALMDLVRSGDTMTLTGDMDKYKVLSFTVNGVEEQFDGTWSVVVDRDLNLCFTVTPDTSNIITIDSGINSAKPTYYNLQGIRVDNPTKGSIYISAEGKKIKF